MAVSRPAAAAALVALFVLLLHGVSGPVALSGRELLTLSDLAVAGLVRPGEVLFRRWKIVERIRDRPGAGERLVERFTLEWIDGADPRRAVGKTLSSSGEMYLAYVSEPVLGRYRPRLYYRAGYAGGEDLVSITPAREEWAHAAEQFSGAERRTVEEYLRRGYLYEPMVSEYRFNRRMLAPGDTAALPRAVLSVDADGEVGGTPVYRVRATEAVRLPFRWQRHGPPQMWIQRVETVRYIAKDTYLTLRSEETVTHETGRTVVAVRELVESHAMPMPEDGMAAFGFDLPPDIEVREQSAFDLLTQVVRHAERAAAFVSAHAGDTSGGR